MTFAETFVISTVQCSIASHLARWTIAITTLTKTKANVFKIIRIAFVLFVCMDVFHKHVNADIYFHREIPENKEETFLLNRIDIVWQRLVDTRSINKQIREQYSYVVITDSQSPVWQRSKHRWRPQFNFLSHVSPQVETSSEHDRFSYSKSISLIYFLFFFKSYSFFHMDMFVSLAVDKIRIHLYDKFVCTRVFGNSTIVHKAKIDRFAWNYCFLFCKFELLDHIENSIHYNFVLFSFFHIDKTEYSFFDMANIRRHDKPVYREKSFFFSKFQFAHLFTSMLLTG